MPCLVDWVAPHSMGRALEPEVMEGGNEATSHVSFLAASI